MQQLITKCLNSQLKEIPRLPKNIGPKDVQLLEQAISSNLNRKVQSSVLKILLAEAYRVTDNEKFSRQISDLGFQYLSNTDLKNEARFRICSIINDSLDQSKLDIVKFHVNQFDQKSDEASPLEKSRFVLVKTAMEALKRNYYKSSLGYYYASKEDSLAASEEEKIQFIEKSILMCFLSQKNKELHQLICQLYTNEYAKKSCLYPLLVKLYSQSMIDESDVEPVKKMLPTNFQKQDSNKITMLSRAIFRHNMLPIKQCFSTISLQTLSKFTNIKVEELQLLIESIYTAQQMEIDQLSGYLHIKTDPLKNQHYIKNLFDKMEGLADKLKSRGRDKSKDKEQ